MFCEQQVSRPNLYKVSAAKVGNISRSGIVFDGDQPGDKIFTSAKELKECILKSYKEKK